MNKSGGTDLYKVKDNFKNGLLNYFKMKFELENILNEVTNDENIMGKPLA